MDPRL